MALSKNLIILFRFSSTDWIYPLCKLAKYYGVTIDSLVHQDNKVDDIKIAPAPIGKHLWGTVTIGSKGQIVIPKAARETFELNPNSGAYGENN